MTSEIPRLDSTRCTGRGDCVTVCPTHCLAMAGQMPWLPRPGDCISCTLCVLVCPDEALTMTHSTDAENKDARG